MFILKNLDYIMNTMLIKVHHCNFMKLIIMVPCTCRILAGIVLNFNKVCVMRILKCFWSWRWQYSYDCSYFLWHLSLNVLIIKVLSQRNECFQKQTMIQAIKGSITWKHMNAGTVASSRLKLSVFRVLSIKLTDSANR